MIAQINSSWDVRVRRDDLVTFQVDGTHGSAVAGLQRCFTQARVNTPKPVWNPDVPQTIDFFDTWQEVPNNVAYDNAFKAEWELFIRHLYEGAPFNWNLLEGAKGVQLVDCALQELGRAALGGRAGARSVRRRDECTGETEPEHQTACGRRALRTLSAFRRRATFRARPAGRSTASPIPPRTSSPIRWRRSTRGRAAPSTGTRPSPTAARCGAWAWAWPRRWTRRSAAWDWTGPRRSS